MYGQLFYSNGAKKGNEFHVSDTTGINQTNPIIAASSSGKFMVGWQQSFNMFYQTFINDGTKLNGKFQININSYFPSIAALKNNNFVACWFNGTCLYCQIFTDNGTNVGSQFFISCGIATISYSVISLANGNFVVAYYAPNNNGMTINIFYGPNNTILKSLLFSV